MMLGQLLRRLAASGDETLLLELGLDLATVARIQEAAAALDLSPGIYVAEACQRFLLMAPEEDWTTALGRARQSPAPGLPFIALAVERQLRLDGEAPSDESGAPAPPGPPG